MKNITFTLLVTLISLVAKSQVKYSTYYENKENLLIHSEIINFDSLPREKIMLKIKNWAGLTFVNAENVIVSETVEQIVFNYEIKIQTIALGIKSNAPWLIRLIIQVKDNKIRLQFYDDGNAFWYSSEGSIKARTHRLNYLFKGDNCKRMFCEGLETAKNDILKTSKTIENHIKQKDIIEKSNDW